MADQDLNELPLLIFANKVDLSHKNASTICKELQLHNLKNPWYVQETVALTGDGLYEGLNWLNDTLSKRK
jgi:ADP-ribosylation factor 1/2